MLISGAQSLRIYCAVVLITDYTMTPEPPIKIAYLLTGTDTGGAEMFCARLVERLDPSKFEPVVISICPKGTLAPTLQATGIPLLSLNIRHKFPLAPMLRLHQTLSKFRPLILHTHLYHANILGRIVGPYTRVPVLICTEHNIGSLPQLWTWAQRCTARRADKIVAVSSAVAEHLATNLGIPGELIEVIHNGIDIEDFIARSCGPDLRSELGLSADTPIVVSVGRLPVCRHPNSSQCRSLGTYQRSQASCRRHSYRASETWGRLCVCRRRPAPICFGGPDPLRTSQPSVFSGTAH